MEKNGWAGKKFVIDGFPRNQDNYDGWTKEIEDTVEVPFILFLDCDRETLIERIMERSRNSGRNDDNIEILNKRLDAFSRETMPVVKLY